MALATYYNEYGQSPLHDAALSLKLTPPCSGFVSLINSMRVGMIPAPTSMLPCDGATTARDSRDRVASTSGYGTSAMHDHPISIRKMSRCHGLRSRNSPSLAARRLMRSRKNVNRIPCATLALSELNTSVTLERYLRQASSVSIAAVTMESSTFELG